MNNCLVTTLKGVVNNDDLEYLDKGILVFDNSLNPEQTEQVNKFYLTGLTTSDIICREGSDKYTKASANHPMIVSTSTPANTTYHFLFDLTKVTAIYGNQGSGYLNVKSNYRLKMDDVLRCSNITAFGPSGVTMDRYNIEELGVLINLTTIAIGGISTIESQWTGDVVNLADSLILNGIDLTSGRVIVLSDGGYNRWNVKVNGTKYARYIHLVFRADGYDIYAPLSSSTALSDYTGETPVYSKTI